MKITATEFQQLKVALTAARRDAGFHPHRLLSTRDQWDVFHRAWGQGAIDGNDLYRRYNDAHIETAMKAIFK